MNTIKLFVIDGCDEAALASAELANELRKIAFPRQLVAKLSGKPTAQLIVPKNIGRKLRHDDKRQVLELKGPVLCDDFRKLVALNRDTGFGTALNDLHNQMTKGYPRLVITTRELSCFTDSGTNQASQLATPAGSANGRVA